MPRLTYADPDAERVFTDNRPTASVSPDHLKRSTLSDRLSAAEDAITSGEFDPQGSNSTEFKRNPRYAGR